MILDACASFCAALSSTVGPTFADVFLVGAGYALVWWRNRKHVQTVVAPLVQRADSAEKAANDARLQLAELKGSLRPMSAAPLVQSSMTPASASTPTNVSGTYEPVVMPELDPKLPRPPAVPNFGEPKQ